MSLTLAAQYIHHEVDIDRKASATHFIRNVAIESRMSVTEEKVEKIIKFQLFRFARRRRLLCKNGMYLAIDKNGVHGTKDPNNPYADLQILSIGSDMLAIWGTKAGLYLAAHHETGHIYTTTEEGRHCVFIESLTPDFYGIYESYKSVYDAAPRCIYLNSQNKLDMTDDGVIPSREGQFIWELYEDEEMQQKKTKTSLAGVK